LRWEFKFETLCWLKLLLEAWQLGFSFYRRLSKVLFFFFGIGRLLQPALKQGEIQLVASQANEKMKIQ
jgi:hypothetical protein